MLCDKCGKEENVPIQIDSAINPTINLPVGWCKLPKGYICDKHTIEIDLNLEKLVINYLADLVAQEII
jgi:hypothetical protein